MGHFISVDLKQMQCNPIINTPYSFVYKILKLHQPNLLHIYLDLYAYQRAYDKFVVSYAPHQIHDENFSVFVCSVYFLYYILQVKYKNYSISDVLEIQSSSVLSFLATDLSEQTQIHVVLLGPVRTFLGQPGAVLGASWAIWGALGVSWDALGMPRTRPGPSKTQPAAPKCEPKNNFYAFFRIFFTSLFVSIFLR